MSRIQRSVTPAGPGWFVVMVDNDMRATVQPVGAWQVVIDSTANFDDPTVMVEPLIPDGRHGAGVLSAPPETADAAVFGPGQNPLPWAAGIEEWAGRRITVWDVSNWWPSEAPVFATADEGDEVDEENARRAALWGRG